MASNRSGSSWTKIASSIISIVIGALLLWSGIQKAMKPDDFALALHDYGLLPLELEHIMSTLLPLAEITVGFLLITGMLVALATFSAACLLLLFSAAMAIVLAQNRLVDCGCGVLGGQVSLLLIMRNLILAALLTGVYRIHKAWVKHSLDDRTPAREGFGSLARQSRGSTRSGCSTESDALSAERGQGPGTPGSGGETPTA